VQRLDLTDHFPMRIPSPAFVLDSAKKRMDIYCASHPSSPAAVKRPSLSRRNNVWVALLGRSVQEGIVGLGRTVEATLQAFDTQYQNAFRLVG